MELDLSMISGETVAETLNQPKQTETQPKKNYSKNSNYGDRENLWTSNNIPIKKIEFLNYTYASDVFTFYYNEKTDNLPSKFQEAFKTIAKFLIDNKNWKFRFGLKKSDINTNILNCTDKKDNFEFYSMMKAYNPDIYDLSVSKGNNKDAFGIVKGFHKSYDKLPGFVRALCAKDVEVLLSPTLDKAVKILFIYTPCGSESVHKDFDYNINGQVGFILKLAKELKISVFNIASPTFKERFSTFIKEGKYISSTAYKVEQGGNDHTDGGKVEEDVNVPKQNVEPTEEEQKKETTQDPTDELFS